jgi:hypothetical protein
MVKQFSCLRISDLESERNTILRNVENHSPNPLNVTHIQRHGYEKLKLVVGPETADICSSCVSGRVSGISCVIKKTEIRRKRLFCQDFSLQTDARTDTDVTPNPSRMSKEVLLQATSLSVRSFQNILCCD